MKTTRTGLILLPILALALLVSARPLFAQTPTTVSAEVDSADLTIYDTVTLTVTVNGANNFRGSPVLPSLGSLQQVGGGIHSQQTITNGQLIATFKFEYTFQPRHTGAIEIGPVRVPIGGSIYETAPITLNVTPGIPSAQMSPSPTQPFRPANSFLRPQAQPNQGDPSIQTEVEDGTYFIEAEVDNDSPYLGEQITYASRFYSADPYFIRPIHNSPDFVGFWNPDRRDRREYPEVINGEGYSVVESSAILFPTIAGDITIEPSAVGVPGGILSGSFREYASPPVEVRVRPLPMNEPTSFTGAVGRYEIEADLDSDSLTLGESVTMTVTISGQGNFDTLPDPVWQEARGWRAFENDSFHRSFVQDGVINGSKTFERVLVPDAAGDYDLPPIEYSYFDPQIEQYLTISTDAMPVQVAPDPSAAAIPDPALTVAEDGAASVPDIRHIKPAPSGIGAPSNPVQLSPLIWGLGVLPVAAIAALAAWRWAATRREAALLASAPVRARQLALSRLSGLDPTATGADAATAALHGYLSAVLGRSSSSLRVTDLKALLQKRGASADTLERLETLLHELDQLRFAPQGIADSGSVGKSVAETVRRIEGEVR